MNANKITSIDFSKPVEDLNLPDDHFDALDEPELTCKVLLYITILSQDYVLFKATRGTDKWFGTMPGDEYRRQQFKDVRRYTHCADNCTGEAIRGRKLETLFERYKQIEETADKAMTRAFNETYAKHYAI